VRTGVSRGRLVLLLAPAAFVFSGCDKTQNALAPKSHQARDIASLFWWMMGGAWIGLGIVVALLLLAWKRSHRQGGGREAEGDKPGERLGWYVVVGAGIVVPIMLLSTLFVVSDLFVIKTTQAPAANATSRTVLVIGHQWWWEVRYPGTGVVTANEIHIPARTRVNVEVRTADVIHSFWVPRLNRKIDMFPEQWNRILLEADEPGRYRGQCAEFCGLQHAKMGLYVFADEPAAFQRWIARQSRPASRAAGAGARVFAENCASCHAIRGTDAQGRVGPDLTHVMSRETLAALAIPNTPAGLRHWIEDPQAIKPGNQMPALPLDEQQLDEVTAYVETLR